MLSMSSFIYCTSSPHQKPDEWKTMNPKKVEWPVMTRSGMVSGSGISIVQGLEELRRSEELSGLISGPFESMRHLTSKTSSFTSSNNQRLLVLRCFQAILYQKALTVSTIEDSLPIRPHIKESINRPKFANSSWCLHQFI